MNLSALLSYPFDQGILTVPDSAKICVMNAPYLAGVDNFGDVTAVQYFYPDYTQWKAKGIEVQAEVLEGQKFDVVLCAVPKQKDFAFSMMAQALQALVPQGLFLFVAANDAGGKRLEKWVQEFGVQTQSLSKSKARIVWGYTGNINQDAVSYYLEKGAAQNKCFGDHSFLTKPGIFGWDKIDRGSALLAQYLPQDLKGIGADFGCGYGFLSYHLLMHNPDIQKLYAIDADYYAVQCAKENLSQFRNVETQWADLAHYDNHKNGFNFIVMNPPFHAAKKTTQDLGQDFIKTAHLCLKKGGALYMVANAHLAYEKILQSLFSSIEKCDEKDGFKVYKAIK